MSEKLYSIMEVAEILGIKSRTTLYWHIKKEHLIAQKAGKNYFVRAKDLEKFKKIAGDSTKAKVFKRSDDNI